MRQTILLLALSSIAAAQPLPPELREALVSEFHFSPSDLMQAEAGQAVAKIVPTGKPDDVRMAGVVLIRVSSDDFIRAFRDVEHFAAGKEVLRTKTFRTPPVEADFAGRHSELTKAEVLACRPGNCSYKMPAQAMVDLQTKIDWSAADANARAETMVHQLLISGLLDYQRRGDAALAVYNDASVPYSAAEGLHSLMSSEAGLWRRFPDLLRYSESYPANKPPDTENVFFWQEAAFGLKHVLRLQHVMIEKLPEAGAQNHYAIVSKMLFATHYFRAAIEFDYVYPVRTASGEPAVYFVAAQRSYVDGLSGVAGAILRRIADSRSPGTLTANLNLAKRQLEGKR